MTLNMTFTIKTLSTLSLAGLLTLSCAFYAHSDQQKTSPEQNTEKSTEKSPKTSAETNINKETEKAEETSEKTAANDKQDPAIVSKTTGAPDDAKTKKNDTFIPSESISEDLAVSFPIDI